ncbi:MAG: hypothetical protein ACLTZF_00770 [Oscillospiraceae bacterium]
MTIFNFLTLLGSLSLFLFGMVDKRRWRAGGSRGHLKLTNGPSGF